MDPEVPRSSRGGGTTARCPGGARCFEGGRSRGVPLQQTWTAIIGDTSEPSRGHVMRVEVFYEDTDMSGLVYHANYLKFIERARSVWVRQLGLDQLALREAGLVFVVRRIEADFLSPARFGDALEVSTVALDCSTARLTLRQEVRRGAAVLFRADVTVVAIAGGRPTRLPAKIRQVLS